MASIDQAGVNVIESGDGRIEREKPIDEVSFGRYNGHHHQNIYVPAKRKLRESWGSANDDDIEAATVAEEKQGLLDDFDENFVDRVADPVEEGTGTLCEVCYCEYKAEDFFSLKCQHIFCVNCQADHLRTKITNGQAMKLPCMQQGCKEHYTLE